MRHQSIAGNGGHAEPVIGRAFARPVGFAHPTDWRLLSLLHSLRATRLAVTHQSIEMHADVGSFSGRVGERNGTVEGDTGFFVALELHQERAAHPEIMKIVR